MGMVGEVPTAEAVEEAVVLPVVVVLHVAAAVVVVMEVDSALKDPL